MNSAIFWKKKEKKFARNLFFSLSFFSHIFFRLPSGQSVSPQIVFGGKKKEHRSKYSLQLIPKSSCRIFIY
jgi:hypothetical protein